MKKRYTVFANKRRRAIRASKDYATLRGMDFKKAKDILTKDGFYEHEYGDKDNNNGYAVYRKGDKEVELQYRWVAGKRKGDAHAGKVTNVYVDEDINSATKVRSRRAIKASGRQIIFPFLVEGEFADGYTCEVGGNSEAECIEKLGNMQNKHGELVWYSGVTDENYEAGKSVYSSSNARRVTASTKYRIDIYKRNNPDALIKRVYEMFDSEDEAYEYGESIANGDEVVVNKVNASTRLPQRRVMASNYNPNGFAVTGYYDSNYRGAAADRYFDPNELDEAASYAHDLLSKGLYVNIIYWRTGDKVDITPDEYFDNFDGDFWCTRDLVEFRDIVQDELADTVWNIQHGDVESSVCTSIKASTDNKADVIAVLSDNGFESVGTDEPWWDKYMWLGFGCTYDMDREDAYVWWNPDGNMVELPYEYSVKTVQDAKALCDDLYNWDEYGLDDLLAAGLPLKGAKKIDTGVYEYSDGDDTAYIDIDNYNGYIIDAYGDRTDYSSLQDLLEEIGIIR